MAGYMERFNKARLEDVPGMACRSCTTTRLCALLVIRLPPPCPHVQTHICTHLSHSALQSLARQAVAEYVKVADKHGLTPSALALAWCDSRWFVASTIIGATSLDQLKVP